MDSVFGQKFQQSAVPFIYAAHSNIEPRLGFAEQALTFLAALLGTHHGQTISVRAGPFVSKHFDESLLKCRRNGVLQTLCFIVNVNPFHPEYLGEHALDQVMAKNGSFPATFRPSEVS